jgi:uncharacterized protein YdeI (YjbR/CyaY-like superfamily)
MPEALAAALEEDDAFRAAWEGLTAGKKRSVVVRVESAKTAGTVAKRVAEARVLVMSGQLAAGMGRKKADRAG